MKSKQFIFMFQATTEECVYKTSRRGHVSISLCFLRNGSRLSYSATFARSSEAFSITLFLSVVFVILTVISSCKRFREDRGNAGVPISSLLQYEIPQKHFSSDSIKRNIIFGSNQPNMQLISLVLASIAIAATSAGPIHRLVETPIHHTASLIEYQKS